MTQTNFEWVRFSAVIYTQQYLNTRVRGVLQHPMHPLGSAPGYSHSLSRTCNVNSLSVLYFNARNIVPKFHSLCSEVEIHKPDIVCLVETWLNDEILDSEITLTNYQLHRLDRNRHGGGIIIYTHNNLATEIITRGVHSLEFMAVSVSNGISKFCISLFSHPVHLCK